MSTWIEYGIDVRKRTILLFGPVDLAMAEKVATGLHMIRGEKPVHLLINSEGGDDDHCRSIIASLCTSKAYIIGHVVGVAESAAAWFLQHCDRRIMYPHSSLMLHMGDSPKNKHTRHIDKMFVDDVLARMVEKDPSYARNKLTTQLGEDWNVYPTQAVELGLADEVFNVHT